MSKIPVGNGGFRSWYSKNEQKPTKSVLYEQKYKVHHEHMSSRRRGDKENVGDEVRDENAESGSEWRRRRSSGSASSSMFDPVAEDYMQYDQETRHLRYESRDQRVTHRTSSPPSSAAILARRRHNSLNRSPSATEASLQPDLQNVATSSNRPTAVMTPNRVSLESNTSERFYTPETSRRDQNPAGPTRRSASCDSTTPVLRLPRPSIQFEGSEADLRMRTIAERFEKGMQRLLADMAKPVVEAEPSTPILPYLPPRPYRAEGATDRSRSRSITHIPETSVLRTSGSVERRSPSGPSTSGGSYVENVVLAHQMHLNLKETGDRVVKQLNKLDSIKHMQRLKETTKAPPGAAKRIQMSSECQRKAEKALTMLRDHIQKVSIVEARIHKLRYGQKLSYPIEYKQLNDEISEWIELPYGEFDLRQAQLNKQLLDRLKDRSETYMKLKAEKEDSIRRRRSSVAIKLTPTGFESVQIERKLHVRPTEPPPIPARPAVSHYPTTAMADRVATVQQVAPLQSAPVAPEVQEVPPPVPPRRSQRPERQTTGTQVTPRLWNSDTGTQVTARLAEGAGFVNGQPPPPIETRTTGTQVTPREPERQRFEPTAVPALNLESLPVEAEPTTDAMAQMNEMLNSIQLHDASLENIEMDVSLSARSRESLPRPSLPLDPVKLAVTVHPSIRESPPPAPIRRRSSLSDADSHERIGTPQTTPRSSIDPSAMSAITRGLVDYLKDQKRRSGGTEKKESKLATVEEEEAPEPKEPVLIKVSVVDRPIPSQPAGQPQASRIPVLAAKTTPSAASSSPLPVRSSLPTARVKPTSTEDYAALMEIISSASPSPTAATASTSAPIRETSEAVIAPQTDALMSAEALAHDNGEPTVAEDVTEVSPFRRMMGWEEGEGMDGSDQVSRPDNLQYPPDDLQYPTDEPFSAPSSIPSDLPSAPLSDLSSQSSSEKFHYSPLSTNSSVASEAAFLAGMEIALGFRVPLVTIITPSSPTPSFSDPPGGPRVRRNRKRAENGEPEKEGEEEEAEDEEVGEEEEETIDLNATEFEHEREEREEKTPTKEGEEDADVSRESEKTIEPEKEEKKPEEEEEEAQVEYADSDKTPSLEGSLKSEDDLLDVLELFEDTSDDSGFLLNNEPPARLHSILDNARQAGSSKLGPDVKTMTRYAFFDDTDSTPPFPPPGYKLVPSPPELPTRKGVDLRADTPTQPSRGGQSYISSGQADNTLDMQTAVFSEVLNYMGPMLVENVISLQRELRGMDGMLAAMVYPPPTAQDLFLTMDDQFMTLDSMSAIMLGEVVDFFNERFGGLGRDMTKEEEKELEQGVFELLAKQELDDAAHGADEFYLHVSINRRLQGINPLFLEYRHDERKGLSDAIKEDYQMQQMASKTIHKQYTWQNTEPALSELYKKMEKERKAFVTTEDDSESSSGAPKVEDEESIEEDLPGAAQLDSPGSSDADDIQFPV